MKINVNKDLLKKLAENGNTLKKGVKLVGTSVILGGLIFVSGTMVELFIDEISKEEVIKPSYTIAQNENVVFNNITSIIGENHIRRINDYQLPEYISEINRYFKGGLYIESRSVEKETILEKELNNVEVTILREVNTNHWINIYKTRDENDNYYLKIFYNKHGENYRQEIDSENELVTIEYAYREDTLELVGKSISREYNGVINMEDYSIIDLNNEDISITWGHPVFDNSLRLDLKEDSHTLQVLLVPKRVIGETQKIININVDLNEEEYVEMYFTMLKYVTNDNIDPYAFVYEYKDKLIEFIKKSGEISGKIGDAETIIDFINSRNNYFKAKLQNFKPDWILDELDVNAEQMRIDLNKAIIEQCKVPIEVLRDEDYLLFMNDVKNDGNNDGNNEFYISYDNFVKMDHSLFIKNSSGMELFFHNDNEFYVDYEGFKMNGVDGISNRCLNYSLNNNQIASKSMSKHGYNYNSDYYDIYFKLTNNDEILINYGLFADPDILTISLTKKLLDYPYALVISIYGESNVILLTEDEYNSLYILMKKYLTKKELGIYDFIYEFKDTLIYYLENNNIELSEEHLKILDDFISKGEEYRGKAYIINEKNN